jgi:hypothetical protein
MYVGEWGADALWIRYWGMMVLSAGVFGIGFIATHLCDFTKSTAFFAEINYHPTAAPGSRVSKCTMCNAECCGNKLLCLLDSLLDPIDEVGSTRAYVRSEHVTSVTLLSSQTKTFCRKSP